MTGEQKVLVKQSWKFLGKVNPVVIGEVFYSKLFLIDPSMKALFARSGEEQSKKLITMLSTIVSRLERIEELTNDIRLLANRHQNYGVKPYQYVTVGSALMWTLEQGLGNDWTQEVEDAWMACYVMLSEWMIEATEDEMNFP